MSTWLDIIGSFIIGTIIILLIANLNLFINSSSADNLAVNIAQLNLKTTADILENDFYKIGYMVSANKIVLADSDEIKFIGDITDDNVSDTVYYYSGPVSEMSSSTNPNDKILYREINNEPSLKVGVISSFLLTYFDSTGTEINYGALHSQVQRNKINTIEIYLKIESQEQIDGAYQAAEWKRKITPKNL